MLVLPWKHRKSVLTATDTAGILLCDAATGAAPLLVRPIAERP